MQQVHRGVRGLVKDSAGELVEGAIVTVEQVDNLYGDLADDRRKI